MQLPPRMARQPMRVPVSAKQRGLKENQARDPYGSGAAQQWQQLPCHNRLNQKKQEGREKDRGAKKDAGSRHFTETKSGLFSRRRNLGFGF